jgi:hypothetical protein
LNAPLSTPQLRWGYWLAAAALTYTTYTIAFTWPLAAHLIDHLRAAPIYGWVDLDLHLWTLAWVSRIALTAPQRLFDANIFHPARLTLAGSDHLLGTLPVAAPVYWLTGSPVAALNAVVLSSFPLAGLGAFALVGAATGSGWAGLLAGFVYAFAPWRTHSFVPVQTFSIQYLPLALLALTAYLRRGGRGVLLAGLAALLLQLLVAYYLAYAALVTLAVWLGAVALTECPLLARRWLALGAGLAGVLSAVAAVSWPYLLRRETGAIRAYGGALGTAFLTRWLGPGLVMRQEHVYLGFVPLGLAALACLPPLGADRGRVAAVGRFLAVALAGWVLCLGSHVEVAGIRVPLPYSWLAMVVPGFSSMRVALRFFTLVILGVGGLAGVGIERIRRGLPTPQGTIVGLALLGAALFEYRPLEWPMSLERVPTGDAVPAAYRWLAAHGEGGPLLEVPVGPEGSIGSLRRESRAMYFSTVHWLPLLNGYTAYPPASYRLLMRVARQLPEAESLQTLVNLVDVRWILLHLDGLPEAERESWTAAPGLALAARFPSEAVFEVTLAPRADWRRTLLEPPRGRTPGGVETAPLPRSARVGRIEAVSIPEHLSLDAGGEATVRVVNLSPVAWPGLGLADDGLVALVASWEGDHPASGPPAVQVVGLPRDLPPAASVVLRFPLSPPSPGVYRLTLALRQGPGDPFPVDAASPLTRTIEVVARR